MARAVKPLHKEDIRQLTGPEKSAVLMLALGEEHGAPIWKAMDEDEIKEVSQIMSNLGTISSSLIEKLLVDFVSQLSSTGSMLGSFQSTERLLTKFLAGDRVSQVMEEIRGPAGRTMWDKLGNVNENVLANYLKNEYPQTVAVVISKIKPEHASRVLGALPEDFALEVVSRMLRMESVQKEILDKVEQTLRVEFMSNLARTSKRDAHEIREAAERIKALMFTFEDLGKLDPGSIQTLLRAVDKVKLGIALKGASDSLRDIFFSNMSERAGKILREDTESMGPVRLKAVDEAQMHMVNTAKDLAAKGEIMIASTKGDDELVY
jgi:flagellar motor switch protein FliG